MQLWSLVFISIINRSQRVGKYWNIAPPQLYLLSSYLDYLL